MAKKKIIKWEPDNFELETKTIWSFPDRGDWATHDGNYRGNWSPYVPRNLILRYSKPGDLVLDQFAGGGTTLVEAKLLKRNIIGIDVNPAALQRCREKCDFDYDSSSKVYVKQGDARKLEFIPDKSIDFICTHLMGDIRRKQHVIPLSFQVMQVFQRAGFTVKEIIIKEQHNCKSTDRWKERSEKYNFLMLAHEYLFVFERGNL